jgi:hypothetical protein
VTDMGDPSPPFFRQGAHTSGVHCTWAAHSSTSPDRDCPRFCRDMALLLSLLRLQADEGKFQFPAGFNISSASGKLYYTVPASLCRAGRID